MDAVFAFSSGIIAGLALAIPLGGLGVLLIQEGVRLGARRALPAAAGVAVVDVLYCTLAILIGSAAAPAIQSVAPWPVVIGGVTLIAVASIGLVTGLRPAAGPVGAAAGTAGAAASGITAVDAAPGYVAWKRFAVFFGLTMINPATLVYFAAITTGLVQFSTEPWGAVLFVCGVGLASFGWQTLLTTAGGMLRSRSGQRTQVITLIVGNSLVVALGLGLIASGLGLS